MIATFDHRPILMFVALATVMCVALLVVALFVTVQPVTPSLSSGNLNEIPSHADIVRTMFL